MCNIEYFGKVNVFSQFTSECSAGNIKEMRSTLNKCIERMYFCFVQENRVFENGFNSLLFSGVQWGNFKRALHSPYGRV